MPLVSLRISEGTDEDTGGQYDAASPPMPRRVILAPMPWVEPGASQQQLSVAKRLERLKIGRFHRRFVALVSLGGWFDLYDLFMVAYLGAALQAARLLTLHQF